MANHSSTAPSAGPSELNREAPPRNSDHVAAETGLRESLHGDRDISDPWTRKTVLTLGKRSCSGPVHYSNLGVLDGGGVRGYSSLLILQELMAKIEEVEREELAD